MTAKGIQNVGNRHFHRYVHTALQVKTQTDLSLTALFERVAEPHFLRSNRIEEIRLHDFRQGIVYHPVNHCMLLCILSCFLVITTRHKRERQIEGAYQHKACYQKSNKSFVLHNSFYLILSCFSLTIRVYTTRTFAHDTQKVRKGTTFF